MNCKHNRRLPNPAGGAWFCADCGKYPLICTPETKASLTDCAAIIQALWREHGEPRLTPRENVTP